MNFNVNAAMIMTVLSLYYVLHEQEMLLLVFFNCYIHVITALLLLPP